MSAAPYRESTPRPDPPPRVRWRWALRGKVDPRGTDMHDLARAYAFALFAALVVWSLVFTGAGMSVEVLRGAKVLAGFTALGFAVFVTRERVS